MDDKWRGELLIFLTVYKCFYLPYLCLNLIILILKMAFNFGNGLIEIAALTTLVGATTAESLILGSRGVAGLPWAAMSTFGSFYIIKTCIAASMPGWLRETLGVNSPLCCSILGVSSKLDNKTMLKVAPGNPAGIRVKNVGILPLPCVHLTLV